MQGEDFTDAVERVPTNLAGGGAFLQRGPSTATSLAPAPANSLPVQCAWCRLWRDGEQWTVDRPGGNAWVGHAVSHGICPACMAKQLAGLRAA